MELRGGGGAVERAELRTGGGGVRHVITRHPGTTTTTHQAPHHGKYLAKMEKLMDSLKAGRAMWLNSGVVCGHKNQIKRWPG